MLFFISLMQEDILLDAQKFGSFLAALRKEHGMTQAELASKLQVTDKAVSRWERGVGLPDIATLTPLANALHVTVSELLQAEKSKDEPPALQEAAADSTDPIPQNTEPQPNRKKHRFVIGVVIGCISLLFALALFLGYPAFPVQKFFFFFLPLCLLSVCEYVIGKQDKTLALLFPLLVACSGFVFGKEAILIAAALLVEYGIIQQKNRSSKDP